MMVNESQKWPTDKPRYDKNYLRLFGKLCPDCNGLGYHGRVIKLDCPTCNGLCYVEKKK